jgi:hypothetical protein
MSLGCSSLTQDLSKKSSTLVNAALQHEGQNRDREQEIETGAKRSSLYASRKRPRHAPSFDAFRPSTSGCRGPNNISQRRINAALLTRSETVVRKGRHHAARRQQPLKFWTAYIRASVRLYPTVYRNMLKQCYHNLDANIHKSVTDCEPHEFQQRSVPGRRDRIPTVEPNSVRQ